TGRGVVDRADVDRDRVGGRVEVDPAIGGPAGVLDLEGERRVGAAVLVAVGHEAELAGVDVRLRDEVTRGEGRRGAGQDERAVRREGRDLDRGQAVGGRAVVDIAEVEVGGGQGVGRAFPARRSSDLTGRGVVDRADVDRDRVGG